MLRTYKINVELRVFEPHAVLLISFEKLNTLFYLSLLQALLRVFSTAKYRVCVSLFQS